MLYRVTYKNDTWNVGGAECTEQEANEFIARRFTPTNTDRARIIMNAIMKENKSNNGNTKN